MPAGLPATSRYHFDSQGRRCSLADYQVQISRAKREKPLPKYFEANDRIRYRVRSGDYLGKIANRYGVSVSSIKRWNGLKSNNLRVGQRLTIYPKRPGAVASAPTKTKTTTKHYEEPKRH